MSFRFRRSIKIAPGIRVNLNKNSASVRIGPRGLGYTVSSTGKKTLSAGIPGTGLSYTEQISTPQRAQAFQQIPAPPDDNRPAHKTSWTPAFIWLVAIGLALGWCANRDPAPSPTTRSAQPPQRSPNTSVAVQSAPAGAAGSSLKMLYTTAAVRLRAGPSTDDIILLTVPSGAAVVSLRTQGLWHNVEYDNITGWIRGDLLKEGRTSAPATAPVQRKAAPAHPAPFVYAPPRQSRSTGSRYITGPRGGCYYVTASGRKQYVDRSMCR